jgi:hypothetical protein
VVQGSHIKRNRKHWSQWKPHQTQAFEKTRKWHAPNKDLKVWPSQKLHALRKDLKDLAQNLFRDEEEEGHQHPLKNRSKHTSNLEHPTIHDKKPQMTEAAEPSHARMIDCIRSDERQRQNPSPKRVARINMDQPNMHPSNQIEPGNKRIASAEGLMQQGNHWRTENKNIWLLKMKHNPHNGPPPIKLQKKGEENAKNKPETTAATEKRIPKKLSHLH